MEMYAAAATVVERNEVMCGGAPINRPQCDDPLTQQHATPPRQPTLVSYIPLIIFFFFMSATQHSTAALDYYLACRMMSKFIALLCALYDYGLCR